MPRRRRLRGVKTLDNSLRAKRQSSNMHRRGRLRSTRGKASSKVDPLKLLESILDDVMSRLGLDLLGLTREQAMEALKPIIEGILDQYSSRPSKESIISRLVATSSRVYMLVSAYLLEKFDKLTPEQLEFIANYGERIAAKHMPRLYREAIRLGREDLIPLLRSVWEKYGMPTAVSCPYCGFRAVTPDLVCMVCGRELSEKDVKNAIDFKERLLEFVELYSLREVEDAISKGYVIVGDVIKPPTGTLAPGDIVLHLSREERDFLRSLLVERRREWRPARN